MINILHVISDKNIGGAGRLLLNLLSERSADKFNYFVALPAGSILTPLITELGVRVFELSESFKIIELAKIIKEISPSIVHSHAAPCARIAARLCGVPFTLNTKHCCDESKIKKSLLRRASTSFFDLCFTDMTIATADYVKEKLIEDGIKKEKIRVIINGSVGLRKLTKAEKSEARKRLGYSDEDFLVGIIGRLEHGKGQEIFIEAARLCPSRRIKFLVVGSGSMERELTARAEGLGNLRFLGHLSDVTEIMNLLDVNVNCSYISETSSLALSEGMSVGAIPVVSECGGNSFMARDCGVTVPKKDAQKLADVLVALSTTPATLAKLKARSEERFARLFTSKRMAKDVETLYLEMAKK